MRCYVAKNHVRLPGYTARPGEVFEAALDEETVQRLVRLGAIETVELPEDAGRKNEPTQVEDDDEELPGESGKEDAPEEPAEEEELPEEIPEIDVMDGISQAAEEAPKKTSKRKTGGKAK